MNPFELFDPAYLFNTRPGSEFMYFWPLLVIFVVIFAASFSKKVKHFASAMRWFSFLGLCLTFTRDQNIPYLGMRLWFVVLFLAAVIYGVWTWKQMAKKASLKPMMVEKKEADKYLPKKKKKTKKSKR